jgi:hypothetical protein
MRFLDSDSSVVHWTKNHGISIEYVWGGLCRKYIPDFLVTTIDGCRRLEEVKGWIREKERFECKKESAVLFSKNNNMEYRVLFEDDLERE